MVARLVAPDWGSRKRKHQERAPFVVTRNESPLQRRSAISTRPDEGGFTLSISVAVRTFPAIVLRDARGTQSHRMYADDRGHPHTEATEITGKINGDVSRRCPSAFRAPDYESGGREFESLRARQVSCIP